MRWYFAGILVVCITAWSLPCRALSVEDYRERGVTVVHIEQGAPMFFRAPDGSPRGLLVDLWRLWSAKTKVPVRFEFRQWDETMAAVLRGDIDIHAGLIDVGGRRETFAFSEPFMEVKTSLIVPMELSRDCSDVLMNGVVGVIENSSPVVLMRTRFPGTRLALFSQPEAMLRALSDGGVQAVVGDPIIFHFISMQRETPLPYAVCVDLAVRPLRAAVAKDNTELMELVNDGWAMVSPAERKKVIESWFVAGRTGGGTFLPALMAVLGIAVLIACAYIIRSMTSRRS